MGARENAVCKACLEILHIRGVPAYRMNSGAYKAGERFIRFGAPGLPDIIGVLPDGRFLGVECKAPEIPGLFRKRRAGKLSDLQKAVHARLIASKAYIITCRSGAEMDEQLRAWGYFR